MNSSIKDYIFSKNFQFKYGGMRTEILVSKFVYSYEKYIQEMNSYLYKKCTKDPSFCQMYPTYIFQLNEFPDIVKEIYFHHSITKDGIHFIYMDVYDILEVIEEFRLKLVLTRKLTRNDNETWAPYQKKYI